MKEFNAVVCIICQGDFSFIQIGTDHNVNLVHKNFSSPFFIFQSGIFFFIEILSFQATLRISLKLNIKQGRNLGNCRCTRYRFKEKSHKNERQTSREIAMEKNS